MKCTWCSAPPAACAACWRPSTGSRRSASLSTLITKLDEATGLASLLSLARHGRLPISYLTDGQNVPGRHLRRRRESIVRVDSERVAFAPSPPDESYDARSGRSIERACASHRRRPVSARSRGLRSSRSAAGGLDEGATTLVRHLGRQLVRMGQRVVLVDADSDRAAANANGAGAALGALAEVLQGRRRAVETLTTLDDRLQLLAGRLPRRRQPDWGRCTAAVDPRTRVSGVARRRRPCRRRRGHEPVDRPDVASGRRHAVGMSARRRQPAGGLPIGQTGQFGESGRSSPTRGKRM